MIFFYFQGSHEHSVTGENNENRDINKNLIHCAELKKLKPRFYSEVLRKKFFVLYEDSRQSLTHPRDPNQSNGDHSDVRNFIKLKFLKNINFKVCKYDNFECTFKNGYLTIFVYSNENLVTCFLKPTLESCQTK